MRTAVLAVVFILALGGRVAAQTSCSGSATETAQARQLLTMINDARADARYQAETHGKAAPLEWSPQAAAAARCHAQEMAAAGQLSHTGANGQDPGTRLHAAGVQWSNAGENVAMAGNIEQVENMMMSEPPFQPNHRANVLNAGFTRVGIGVVDVGGLVYVCEDFYTPLASHE